MTIGRNMNILIIIVILIIIIIMVVKCFKKEVSSKSNRNLAKLMPSRKD